MWTHWTLLIVLAFVRPSLMNAHQGSLLHYILVVIFIRACNVVTHAMYMFTFAAEATIARTPC